MSTQEEVNPLGFKPVGQLLKSLAIPAMVANIVNAFYNIVDQIFIGQGVGTLGNAATSVAFPITTISMAIGLMIGIGSSSGFGLELGRANKEKAKQIVGTGTTSLLIAGVVLATLVITFLEPLLNLFGTTANIMPYAKSYASITALGLPFFLVALGVNPLVRGDRSPKYSMMAIIIGAVLNTIIDPIFIFVFEWGISGASWATVISQIVSAMVLLAYFPRFKSVKLTWVDFKPRWSIFALICKLGLNSFIFQFSNVIVQVVLNNSLNYYGGLSPIGADTPLAVAGIVNKVNVIFVALIIGLSNGVQPITSFNYGAQKYDRVIEMVKLYLKTAFLISLVMWLIFEILPGPILSLFGSSGSDTSYMAYATRFMRTYLFFILVSGMQVTTSNFLPSIGEANKGALLSFLKQVIILIPLIIILPMFMGLNGVMYAQPITDIISFVLTMYVLYKVVQDMLQKQAELKE